MLRLFARSAPSQREADRFADSAWLQRLLLNPLSGSFSVCLLLASLSVIVAQPPPSPVQYFSLTIKFYCGIIRSGFVCFLLSFYP